MSDVRCSYCGSSFEESTIRGHVVFCSKRDQLPGVGIPLRTLLLAFFVSGLLWWLFWWAAFGARADHGEGWELKRSLPSVVTEDEHLFPLPEPELEWAPLVTVYDWDADRMLRILYCESRGNPYAVSHTDDHGLFQIHWPIWGPAFGVTRTQLYDPTLNVDIAYRVFAQQGYSAWVCDRLIN